MPQSPIPVEVDASDTAHALFSVRQHIPAGAMADTMLALPKWLPAYHAPRGPIDFIAGLKIEYDGRPVRWQRDPADPFVFHIDDEMVGKELLVTFDRLTPTENAQGRILITDDIMRLQWEGLCLYPASTPVGDIILKPSVRLPDGWSWACSLDQRDLVDGVIRFDPVDLRTLIDSPLLAGLHTSRVTLGNQVDLFVAADRTDQLPAASRQIDAHKRLIDEADVLFGRRPFERYDFLMSLSDQLSRSGLEHRSSSECGVKATYFSDWDRSTTEHDLLPHEYVHAWVGKYRVPQGNFRHGFSRMTDELMWVYEGLTQYYGHVLAARSGLISAEHTLQAFALIYTTYDTHRGRDWRPLADTDMDPIFTAREPQPWRSWQRSEDYYSEGLLIWLEADMLIRTETAGKCSLDDFMRSFFAPPQSEDLRPPSKPYDRNDIIAALDAVHSYDWTAFFAARVDEIAPRAPYAGIELGGYELTWRNRPTDWLHHDQHHHSYFDFSYSTGFKVGLGAKIIDVLWGGPGYDAGLVRGTKILAVGDRSYSHAALQDATDLAASQGDTISLTVQRFDHVRQVEITGVVGQRYPDLAPTVPEARPLDALLRPQAKPKETPHV